MYYAHLNRVTAVYLPIWQSTGFHAIQLNNSEIIKNMCTNHWKNTQHDTNLGIGFVTTLSAAYDSSGALLGFLMAASGGSVLALGRDCQQLLKLSGLRSMWLPAIVPDLVLQKNILNTGRYNRCYAYTRQYRCTMNHQVNILAPVLPAA